jgi:hypothetical protein
LIASVIWTKDLIGCDQPPCPDIEGVYVNETKQSIAVRCGFNSTNFKKTDKR